MSNLLKPVQENYILEFFKRLGLKRFELEVSEQVRMTPDPSYTIILHAPLTFNYSDIVRGGDGEALLKALEPFADDIRQSPFLKDALSEKDEEIKKLKICVTELQRKVDELAPFKTHYNLQFKMAHGKDEK